MSTAPTAQPIFTLDARDNVMLEVVRDGLKLSTSEIGKEIVSLHLATQKILASKGIPYLELRSGLVPSTDHNEAAFMFDRGHMQSNYGFEVAHAILPILDKRTTQSVLCGDLICNDLSYIPRIMKESLVPARAFDFKDSNALYCVYINNLTDGAIQDLHSRLVNFPAYIGYVPTTFATEMKTFLSTMLVHAFLKHKSKVIMGHEDDRSIEENVNMAGYPFTQFGYEILSLPSMYFDIFLGYKIERAVYPGFAVDTEMALSAISNKVIPLRDCVVFLEEAKHGYLLAKKLGSLQKAEIDDLERTDLEELIKSKIALSYIYNLNYSEKYDVAKFNLMLEVPRSSGGYPTRLLVSLEYIPQEKILRVLTLY